ncbi:MAG: hypothetical protein ACRC92_26730 [Peptostreptococcaceae bacterium]
MIDYIKTLKSRPYLALNKDFMTRLLEDKTMAEIITLIKDTSLAVIDYVPDEDKIGIVASFGGVGFDSIDFSKLSVLDRMRYYELISMLDVDKVIISEYNSTAFDVASVDLFCEGIEDELLEHKQRIIMGFDIDRTEFERYLKVINIILWHTSNSDITNRLNTTEVLIMEELGMIHDCDDSIFEDDMNVCEDLNKAPSNKY